MPSNYTVRIISSHEKEVQAVMQFGKMYYVNDAPLVALKLDCQDEERNELWTATLQQGLSVLALDDHGEIIGISFNALIKKEEAKSCESIPNTHVKGIDQLFLHLKREDKMWDKLPKNCDTVLEVQNCAVHPEWRGKGVMTALCAETEQIAQAIGAGALRLEAISTFAAKAAEKCGFRLIYQLPYKDQTYTPKPSPPHLEARVYIKELAN